MKPGKDFIGVACGALVFNDKGEVLLFKRGPKCRNEVGFWSRPGGTVEFGEKIEEAVKREVLEEVGVEVEIVRAAEFFDHHIPAEKQHWITVTYICRVVKGEPKMMEPDKMEELAWFALDRLPSPMSPQTERSIAAYLKHLHGKSN